MNGMTAIAKSEAKLMTVIDRKPYPHTKEKGKIALLKILLDR